MEKRAVNPAGLAAPQGFNHAIIVSGGRLVVLAGQDASDQDGRIVGRGDLLAQCEQVLRNLQTVMDAAGGRMHDIVKLNVFVRDCAAYRAALEPLGGLFRAYFGRYYPAMALFEVTGFFRDDTLIEMEGLAVVPES